MADITLDDLTNTTTDTSGSGVFDVLMQSVELRIIDQYSEGRITGSDFASVYLGSLQSVISESIKFLLAKQQADKQADLISEQINSEVKKNEDGGIFDLEKEKLQEAIDLLIAQAANQYEQIEASRQNTSRDNKVNEKQLIKIDRDITLLTSQNSELLLNGPAERELKEAQTSELLENGPIERALKAEQTAAVTSGITNTTAKTNAEVELLDARELETEASTVRQDAESAEKVLLLEAQTIGFKTDSKQKMLKTMMDGVGINTTIDGAVLDTSLTTADGVQDVANDILTDWGETGYL